jgi:hypothetical protein
MRVIGLLVAVVSLVMAEPLTCDVSEYRQQAGLAAVVRAGQLEVTWRGEPEQELRAIFASDAGRPVVAELAARKAGGAWVVLASKVVPQFEITSGKRRISNQQLAPLKALGRPITPEIIEKEKWNAFWDAPLEVPG